MWTSCRSASAVTVLDQPVKRRSGVIVNIRGTKIKLTLPKNSNIYFLLAVQGQSPKYFPMQPGCCETIKTCGRVKSRVMKATPVVCCTTNALGKNKGSQNSRPVFVHTVSILCNVILCGMSKSISILQPVQLRRLCSPYSSSHLQKLRTSIKQIPFAFILTSETKGQCSAVWSQLKNNIIFMNRDNPFLK